MTELHEFERLVGGVLKASGLTRADNQYDDYFQELLLIIWEQLQKQHDLAPKANKQLFRLLLWRLRDLQRKEWQHQARYEPSADIDGETYSDCYMEVWRTLKAKMPYQLQAIYQNVLNFPDLTLRERSQLLSMHRKTLRRRLNEIAQHIK